MTLTSNILSVLDGEKVRVTVSLFGRDVPLTAKWNGYLKPFVELEVNGVTRLFNEHRILEIIPLQTKGQKLLKRVLQ